MRVLHVNKFLYRRGGAEAYMIDLAGMQEAAGDEVAFFGMDHPSNEPMPYARHFPSYVEFRGGSMARIRASTRMFYSSSAEAGIDAVVEDFRPDLVHMHNIYHQLSPSILRPLVRRGIATVMTLHDYKLACPNHQFLDHGRVCEACLGGNFFNAVLRRCKDGSLAASALVAAESYAHRISGAYAGVRLFIAPSRFLAGKMTEAGVFPEKMRTVNHFVDAVQTSGTSGVRSGFVYAGRLSSEKGVDVLIKAAGLMPDATIEVLGDGPAKEALERLAETEAPGRVRFHGRVDKATVQDAMLTALAVVVPSVWYENQPMTVLEAMACATPVIASNIGGIAELVTDGVSGLTPAAGNPEALAQAMRRLAAGPQEALEMGRRAQERVSTEFTPAVHLRRVREVYAEASGVAAALAV